MTVRCEDLLPCGTLRRDARLCRRSAQERALAAAFDACNRSKDLAAEGGTGLWRRIKAWHQMHGVSWQDAPFHVVPIALDLMQSAQAVVAAAERVANIQRWTRMPAGGHFAAPEEPDLVANDVADFFDQFR